MLSNILKMWAGSRQKIAKSKCGHSGSVGRIAAHHDPSLPSTVFKQALPVDAEEEGASVSRSFSASPTSTIAGLFLSPPKVWLHGAADGETSRSKAFESRNGENGGA